jgi:hypothetical protein
MRKGFGFKYQQQTRRLADFVSFMEKRGATTITTKLAMEWATLPSGRHASWALRLTDVRGFARHIASIDPKRGSRTFGAFWCACCRFLFARQALGKRCTTSTRVTVGREASH